MSRSLLSQSRPPRVTCSRALALVFALCLGGGALACRDADKTDARPDVLPSGVVNQPLYAFLSKARAAHHEADLAESSGDRRKAVEALAKITAGARPRTTPEVTEVLADAHARAADLLSQEGDFDGGIREIDAGLALAVDPTHFRGHLFEVRGVVEERRSKHLREIQDDRGADAAKERAIEAFQKAIETQDIVIESALTQLGSATPSDSAPTSVPSSRPTGPTDLRERTPSTPTGSE